MITLFYGYPPGSSGRNSAYVQGYVRDIDDVECRNHLFQRFLAIPGMTQQGNYTVDLNLNAETLESAKKLIQVVLDVNTQLSQMSLVPSD